METQFFKSKIDWWVYFLIPFVFLCCVIGPILSDSDYWLGLILAILLSVFIFFQIRIMKYAIRGKEFGVRGLNGWQWFPIEKIESVAHINSIVASTALSTRRIAIKFSDRKILKSYAPIEISPKDDKEFIAELLRINPNIKVVS